MSQVNHGMNLGMKQGMNQGVNQGVNQGLELPHDIRDLVPYELPWALFLAYGLLALVALALALWGWRRWRRGRAKLTDVPPVDPLDSWKALFARLEALRPTGAFAPGPEQEDYFYNLSLLLREGIERRSALRATDLTLQELKDPLRRKLPLPTETVDELIAFLERADLIKFAGVASTLTEAEEARLNVRRWLERLKPRDIDQGSPLDRVGKTAGSDLWTPWPRRVAGGVRDRFVHEDKGSR